MLLRPRVLHHPDSLDACLLDLEDEPEALARMKEHGLELAPLELSNAVPGEGQVGVEITKNWREGKMVFKQAAASSSCHIIKTGKPTMHTADRDAWVRGGQEQ